jgi:hypothetical protein
VTPIVVHHRPTATPRPLPTAFIAPLDRTYSCCQMPAHRLVEASAYGRSLSTRGDRADYLVPKWQNISLSSTAYTDRHGGLRDTLSVPASPPGPYRVLAEINGVPYAEASYHVISGAALQVTSAGNTLVISGGGLSRAFDWPWLRIPPLKPTNILCLAR